jgi:hypothetical protein
MRSLIVFLATFPVIAFATTQKETPVYSRALQQAKRVAVMENGKDLPSRAYWLGSRVVKKSKSVSFQSPQNQKSKSSVKN